MTRRRRGGLLQKTITLLLLGVLAGALGGIAVGVMTSRSSSAAVSVAP